MSTEISNSQDAFDVAIQYVDEIVHKRVRLFDKCVDYQTIIHLYLIKKKKKLTTMADLEDQI